MARRATVIGSHLGGVVDVAGSQLLRWPRHPITTVRGA
jgi:hypothetical protein